MKFQRWWPLYLVGLVTVGFCCAGYWMLQTVGGAAGWAEGVGTPNVYEGVSAREEIGRQLANGVWLAAAEDCYLFDNGTFSGSGLYAAASLQSVDQCFHAIAATSDFADDMPVRADMLPWEGQSGYPAVTDGPGHFGQEHATPLWDGCDVENGLYFEQADGNSRLVFWLIDLDENRFYYHYQSGGIL